MLVLQKECNQQAINSLSSQTPRHQPQMKVYPEKPTKLNVSSDEDESIKGKNRG